MSEVDQNVVSKKKLSELRVVDLRYHLEKRGLDKNGIKTALVERLTKAVEDEGENPEEFLFDVFVESVKLLGKSPIGKRLSRKSKENGDADNDDDEEKQEEEEKKKDLIKEEDESQKVVHCNGSKDIASRSGENTTSEASTHSSAKPELIPVVRPLNIKDTLKIGTSGMAKKASGSPSLIVKLVDAHCKLNEKTSPKGCATVSLKKIDASVKINKDNSIQAGDKEQKPSAVTEEAKESLKSGEVQKAKTRSEVNVEGITQNTVTDVKEPRLESAHKESSASTIDKSIGAKNAAAGGVGQGEPEKIKRVYESCKNLWVSGLSDKTKAADLKTLFSKHGKVLGAKIVTNSKTPYTCFYGFVMMSSDSDASACIEHLHRAELHGRMLSVEKTTRELSASVKKPESKPEEVEDSEEKLVKLEPQVELPVEKVEEKEDEMKAEEQVLSPDLAEAEKEVEVTKEEGGEEEGGGGEEEEEGGGGGEEEEEKPVTENEGSDAKSSGDEKKETDKTEGIEKKDKKKRTPTREHRSRERSKELVRRSRNRDSFGRCHGDKGHNPGRVHHHSRRFPTERGDRYRDRLRDERKRRHGESYRSRSPERTHDSRRLSREWETVRKERERLEYERLKLEVAKQQVERERLEREKAELRKHAHITHMDERRGIKRQFDAGGVKEEYWEGRKRAGGELNSPGRFNNFNRGRPGYHDKRAERFDNRSKGEAPHVGQREGRHPEVPERRAREDWKGGKPREREFDQRAGGARSSHVGNERVQNFDRPNPWDGANAAAENTPNKYGPAPVAPPAQWNPGAKPANWGRIDAPPPERWGGVDHARGQPPITMPHPPNLPHPPNQAPMYSGSGNGMINSMPGNFTQGERFSMNNMRRF